MRWNFKDFDQSPELSSDIEWMLQSRQVSRELILETLVAQYYLSVSLLAISLLDDQSAARAATRDIFIRLLHNLHQYRSTVGVKKWVYQTAYQVCLRRQRGERVWRSLEKLISAPGQFTDPIIPRPPSDFDRKLWFRLDELDHTDRTLMILRYGNGWDISEISGVTGMEEQAVSIRLNSSLDSMLESQDISPEEAHLTLQNSLDSRWRRGAIPEEDIERFIKRFSQRAVKNRKWRREMSTAREMILLGLALLFVILIIWGGNRYLLQENPDLDSSGGLRPIPVQESHLAHFEGTLTATLPPDGDQNYVKWLNRVPEGTNSLNIILVSLTVTDG